MRMATEPKTIRCAVVTVGRSDFSILRPLVSMMQDDPTFEAGLWIAGAHYDPQAGMTVENVRSANLPIWAELSGRTFDATPLGTTRSMSEQMGLVEQALTSGPAPDVVVILGDRFEAVSIGLALVPHNIPVAHISGGSVTEGAIDDVFRHCLTKIAAFHYCDVPAFARRIQNMGENPAHIRAVGALGLDGIRHAQIQSFDALREAFGISESFEPGYVIATLHPETRSLDGTKRMVGAMLQTLEDAQRDVILTYPNADPNADVVIEAIEAKAKSHPRFHVVQNFGFAWFYTAMSHASLMIGNSSSGIIEAGSFQMPVINIGDRQYGRYCEENVIHCAPDPDSIKAALNEAAVLAPQLQSFRNPYGDGHAAERILEHLKAVDWTVNHARKAFFDADPSYTGELVKTG